MKVCNRQKYTKQVYNGLSTQRQVIINYYRNYSGKATQSRLAGRYPV